MNTSGLAHFTCKSRDLTEFILPFRRRSRASSTPFENQSSLCLPSSASRSRNTYAGMTTKPFMLMDIDAMCADWTRRGLTLISSFRSVCYWTIYRLLRELLGRNPLLSLSLPSRRRPLIVVITRRLPLRISSLTRIGPRVWLPQRW